VTAHEIDDENTNADQPEELLDEEVLAEEIGEATSTDPIEILEDAVAAAQQKAADAKQSMLLMKADFENLRKRLMREQEKTRRRTLERFMGDLLPVRDSLERGLLAAEDPTATLEALREGKQLIMKMLSKVMGDHGLEIIDPVGESFDPEKHEAMTMLPSAEHDENTVIDVLEKGYQLHDRLIRPAKVVVSRKP
jgi:molecular chaperone GrpE